MSIASPRLFDVAVVIARYQLSYYSQKVDKGINLFKVFIMFFDVDCFPFFADDQILSFSNANSQGRLLAPLEPCLQVFVGVHTLNHIR